MLDRRSFLLGLTALAFAGSARGAMFACDSPPRRRAAEVERARAAFERQVVEGLPALGLPAHDITVSGLSSGGAMAMQMHVAFSGRVIGAGILAGTAYGCALDDSGFGNFLLANASRALGRCMKGSNVPVDELAARIRRFAHDGRIDPPEGLRNARVWLLSGGRDSTVAAAAIDAVASLYRDLGAKPENVRRAHAETLGHGWPSTTPDSDPHDGLDECGLTEPPFLNRCAWTATRTMLDHILGRAQPAVSGEAAAIVRFDQRPHGVEDGGLAEFGLLCLPPRIDSATRLHVAFHGCCQGAQRIGGLFATETGLAAAARDYNLAVLFPQAAESRVNPRGCWDWWGYTEWTDWGADSRFDFPTRCGPQIRAVARMIERLSGEAMTTPDCRPG
jgi:poly(3-hydroxybutyrate) depolymerase